MKVIKVNQNSWCRILFGSLQSYEFILEDIASFISAANKLTLLFDFFNDDASNIQDVERILRTFDFEPAYRQYYSNLRVLIHLIQVPDSNNLYLFKFYYTAETDLMILIQCMYSTLPQKFTISEVEEDQ